MTDKPGHALIIGAGIGGIKTALDLAQAGFEVTLMERAPNPDGILAKLDRQFPTNRCGMCRMLPSLERGECAEICLRRGLFHDRINLMVSTELESLEGEPGNFKALVKTRNCFIDPDLCNGCGECEIICPETRSDPFNQDLSTTKAVYLPTPHLMKNSYRIDPDACTLCGKCVEACPAHAITLPSKDHENSTPVEKRNNSGELRRKIEADIVVLASGTGYFDPGKGKNPFGYGIIPGVVTGIELERMLNPAGPTMGRLRGVRDTEPVERMAWIQCVGSRDIQNGPGYCSSICCMHAVKEAVMVKEISGGSIDTVIYYMDLRCFGKSHTLYMIRAREKWGVKFRKVRPHSLFLDDSNQKLMVDAIDENLSREREGFDMVVLSQGQRPARGLEETCRILNIETGKWGFPETQPMSTRAKGRDGVFLAGSSAGLMDIAGTIIQSGAAAGEAGVLLNQLGKAHASTAPLPELRDVNRETPKIFVAVCQCPGSSRDKKIPETLKAAAQNHPQTVDAAVIPGLCTEKGWQALTAEAGKNTPNRILVAACLPHIFQKRFKELGRAILLDHTLIHGIDILNLDKTQAVRVLEMELAKIRRQNQRPRHVLETSQRVLVLGGGPAGMTAALTVADQGGEAVLVERSAALGGNLNWLGSGAWKKEFTAIMEELSGKVTSHPLIQVHTRAELGDITGEAGDFHSIIKSGDEIIPLDHGALVAATGGREAATDLYGHGTHPGIMTQQELTMALTEKKVTPADLSSVVMIQCVGSRDETRPYCSRICCPSALKHASLLLDQNPGLGITILYRDIMTPGFDEFLFKEARERGVVFIPYTLEEPPEAALENEKIQITVKDPILNQRLRVEASLLVLATGVTPNLPECLIRKDKTLVDELGFFQEADAKWRPVDTPREGIFACGLALGPRNVKESAATGRAAAQRALRIMGKPRLTTRGQVSETKTGLCTLCLRCVTACAFGARSLDRDLDEIRINPLLCQGCGACASACPSNAAYMPGFDKGEMFEILDRAI